ncbi:porphobilinogen synthase [Leptospira sp. GIMC2001]|uniref:porphobilinogen synthase n=1 Tax=Leptospira sp. GIMC2001 TaxID=1513297 RepID=UPI00234A3AC7|nr:porphobilinogen synthase [Leptospira sp. GIMC2001]WCL50094.1 porphobilinogen synthase [Leptospira sp. GIMC2001]
MIHRFRNLRKSDAVRRMVAETTITADDFILPIFITEGSKLKEEISSMPNYFRMSLDMISQEIEEISKLGVQSVLLFTKVEDDKKTDDCREALNEKGLMVRSIQRIKSLNPNLIVMTDVALDPFSPYGHDGIVRNSKILNDETVDVLARMSELHAVAGADFVAPSDMMDGRIIRIRERLEETGNSEVGILSYSAKYASSLYGPFRDALESAPGFGDKKTYQMDYRNRLEAIREVVQDVKEGADIVMIKPAGMYLDIIREVRNTVTVPVAAYQVSGEYAMIKASAINGWISEETAILESIYAIKRAGADLIASYFTKDVIRLLKND